jgi:cytochrome c oxidase subunit 4
MTGLAEDLPHGAGAIWRRTLPVWAGLVALLAATVAGAYIPLGRFNLVLALGIAVVKAALVVLFFMHLRQPDPLLRLTASAALVFLAFLFTLAFADVLMRAAPTQPGTVMPRTTTPPQAIGQRAF